MCLPVSVLGSVCQYVQCVRLSVGHIYDCIMFPIHICVSAFLHPYVSMYSRVYVCLYVFRITFWLLVVLLCLEDYRINNVISARCYAGCWSETVNFASTSAIYILCIICQQGSLPSLRSLYLFVYKKLLEMLWMNFREIFGKVGRERGTVNEIVGVICTGEFMCLK